MINYSIHNDQKILLSTLGIGRKPLPLGEGFSISMVYPPRPLRDHRQIRNPDHEGLTERIKLNLPFFRFSISLGILKASIFTGIRKSLLREVSVLIS